MDHDLECRVEEQHPLSVEPLRGKYSTITDMLAAHPNISTLARRYAADVTATWMFYGPSMAAVEWASGMHSEKIVISRLSSAGIAMATTLPYTLFRSWFADRTHADTNSSPTRKLLVDTGVALIVQPLAYGLILSLCGVSPEQAEVTIPLGAGFSILTARPYGYFIDHLRKRFGVQATL